MPGASWQTCEWYIKSAMRISQRAGFCLPRNLASEGVSFGTGIPIGCCYHCPPNRPLPRLSDRRPASKIEVRRRCGIRHVETGGFAMPDLGLTHMKNKSESFTLNEVFRNPL